MKRFMLAITVAIMLSFGVAHGQDTSFSVGVKAWVNSWEMEIGTLFNETTDPALMIGPSVSINYDRFFGGATLLFTPGEYEWDFGGGEYERAKRTDLDLIAGYMFIPRLGVFVGYKHLSADMEYEELGIKYDDGTITLSGPGFGLTGNYPVSNNIVLYGSLSFMALEFEWYSETTDASGASVEFGAAYIISPNWNASVGFKHQAFVGDLLGQDLTNSFTGLTFGANYRF